MEMETPNGSSERRNQAAEYAHKLEDNNLAYVKNDGSLECGLELVTHPMTHDFYKQENSLLWEVVNGLKNEHNMRSWSTRTCGLHIHISRAGFNGGSHMHRFLNLIYSNQALYERLAGRKASRWATFDDTLTEPKNVYDEAQERWVIQPSVRTFKHKLGMHSERYSAVNTNNRNTLEIRIFRGTLNESTIKSHLDLAHASVEYTRTLSVRDVAEGALHADRFIKYIYDHSEKYADLCRRLAQMTVSSTDTENV
jgi:hypothetical protein